MIPKRSKYKSSWVTIDGLRFQSAAEGERYKTLRDREHRGEISHLELQPVFDIRHPINDKLICKYQGDFRYRSPDGIIVEDVKGMKTRIYQMKKKMMRIFHDINITEVTWRARTKNKVIVAYRWIVNGVEET